MFSYDADDRRSSFRVRPPSTEPIGIEFQGKSVFVKDIGGGGLSFRNNRFKVGDSQSITLALPGEDITVHVTMEIVEIDEQDVCHGRFTASSHEAINAIHRYMLTVQKDMLRMRKRAARKMPNPEKIADQAKHDAMEAREEDVTGTTGLAIPGSFSVD
jgi:hypothetical protein